ncbi:MAG: ATP-dependent 6-phosphofructokinase [Oscillospiraceae bacterium]|jgi:6-phosphofructokinase 1|nr:ATP-dependent 6-phosphofructokinase [Oscillospiraceae bacterium]
METRVGKHIGILTSGGDSPGMNAAIRAVVLAAREQGFRTLGIRRGYRGLCAGDWFLLTPESVEGIERSGGTILRSARMEEFKEKETRAQAIAGAKAAGIEGLIVIGGDGSFAGARELSGEGLPCIGLPGTIDNDIVCTEFTIGYDTALNTVIAMADAIADTARSHDRCVVVEVMGNTAGDLTLYSGLACGATAVLLLEETNFCEEKAWNEAKGKNVLRFLPNPAEVERLNQLVAARVCAAKRAGQNHFLVFVAEGITGKKDGFGQTRYPGGTDALAAAVEAITAQTLGSAVESRAQVLAYVQRGGNPTARDRILASQMGDYAVQLLREGKQNQVVIARRGEIIGIDIDEALRQQKEKKVGVNLGAYLNPKDSALTARLSIASVAGDANQVGDIA